MRAVFLLVAFALVSACGGAPAADARKPLYWRDPMHPSYTSDRPGKAPDCGMDLEPVYADAPAATAAAASTAVTLGRVEHGDLDRTVRTIGRVVPDESRVFPVVAGCEGWITKLEPKTATGDRVRRGQPLAAVYGREYATAERSFLYALEAAEKPPPGDSSATRTTLEEARRYLENLGVGEAQIRELERTRQIALDVTLASPASGIVVARGAYPRQRFDRDTELFRIANLDHVWILADLPADDPGSPPAGSTARVTPPGSADALDAVVSGALARFDPSSRTAKLRLEADNPGLTLSPDMIVDVELHLRMPAITSVPASAVLDAGGGKQVFVDKGEGRYEARAVQVGRRFGDRIEIVSGLSAGESIVTSGGFLLEADRRLHRD